ncbi:MAG: hypothetical protein KAV82_08090 [Phycisphaerae bacterium]|nr:hypothetical protein [Phycisphaerae bacterium]
MTDQDRLLKTYDLVVREEHYFLDAHQKRVAFCATLVLFLMAGTVVGVFMASRWYHFASLCAGPILVYVISSIARDACFRFYQRYLEAVTSRAKIEQDLGLTRPRLEPAQPDAEQDVYWAAEPIIAPRHVISRKHYHTSEDFIRSNMKRGFHRWTERLFRGLEVFSGVAFVGLLFLAILTATESLPTP